MDKKLTVSIAAAAFLFMMVAAVIHGISSQLTMHYYTDPAYSQVWSSLIMQGAQPGNTFVAFSLIINFIIGALYSQAYHIIKGGIPGGNYLKKGANYGLVLFLVASLPMALMLFLLMNIPLMLLIVWTLLDGFVLLMITGIIAARIVN